MSDKAISESFADKLLRVLRDGPLDGIPFCLVIIKRTKPTGLCSRTTLGKPEHEAKLEFWARRIVDGGVEEASFDGFAFGEMPLVGRMQEAVRIMHPMLVEAVHGCCLVLGTIESYATVDASGCDLVGVAQGVLAMVAHERRAVN